MTSARVNLAVGFFDGVHLGHQKILSGADAVLTFRNHPSTVLQAANPPALLMDVKERLGLLATEGAARPRKVKAVMFTRRFAAMPPERFADFLRREYPNLARIHCGGNWRFGEGGAGTPDTLRRLGFDVKVCRYAKYKGERVSSTRIRAALADGAVGDANAMLGRPFSVEGRIAHGKGVGRSLGFPTLNIEVSPPLRHGVYAVDTPMGKGVANYGVAPTMGGRAWPSAVLEVHLFESGGARVDMAAGGLLRVAFLSFVRPEMAFRTVGELRRQISADVAACIRHPWPGF